MGCKKLAIYPEKTTVTWHVRTSSEHKKMHVSWYDYGARFYDAQIARFHTLDPLAEIYSFQSPFAYAANNPIYYVDYLGMGPREWWKNIKSWVSETKSRAFETFDRTGRDQNNENAENNQSNDEISGFIALDEVVIDADRIERQPWEEFGISKEDYDDLSPEHKEWIKGANKFVRNMHNCPDRLKAQKEFEERMAALNSKRTRPSQERVRRFGVEASILLFDIAIDAFGIIRGSPQLGPVPYHTLPQHDDEEIMYKP